VSDVLENSFFLKEERLVSPAQRGSEKNKDEEREIQTEEQKDHSKKKRDEKEKREHTSVGPFRKLKRTC